MAKLYDRIVGLETFEVIADGQELRAITDIHLLTEGEVTIVGIEGVWP